MSRSRKHRLEPRNELIRKAFSKMSAQNVYTLDYILSEIAKKEGLGLSETTIYHIVTYQGIYKEM